MRTLTLINLSFFFLNEDMALGKGRRIRRSVSSAFHMLEKISGFKITPQSGLP